MRDTTTPTTWMSSPCPSPENEASVYPLVDVEFAVDGEVSVEGGLKLWPLLLSLAQVHSGVVLDCGYHTLEYTDVLLTCSVGLSQGSQGWSQKCFFG